MTNKLAAAALCFMILPAVPAFAQSPQGVSLTASDLIPCRPQLAQLQSDAVQYYRYSAETSQFYTEIANKLAARDPIQLFIEGWGDGNLGMGFRMPEVYDQNFIGEIAKQLTESDDMIGTDLRNGLYTATTWKNMQRCVLGIAAQKMRSQGTNGASNDQGPLGLRNMPADGVSRGPETGVAYFTGGTVRTDGFICDAAFCNAHWLRVILYAEDPYGAREANVTVNNSEKSFDFNQPIAGGIALRAEITEQDRADHYNCSIESTEPTVPTDDDARSPSLPAPVVNIRCTMTSTGRAAVDEAHRLKRIRDAQITN